MKLNRIAIGLALLALWFAALSCAMPGGQPTASNFYMASDAQGANKTTSFGPTDDFYIFFDVSSIPAGTVFESKWYTLNLPGQDPNTPFQTLDYTYQSGISKIYLELKNGGPWPSGSYKVEVDMSGTKVGELQFSVQ